MMIFMQLIVMAAMVGLTVGFMPSRMLRNPVGMSKISMYATSTTTPEMISLEQKLTQKALAREAAAKTSTGKSSVKPAVVKAAPAKAAPAKVAPVVAKAAPAKAAPAKVAPVVAKAAPAKVAPVVAKVATPVVAKVATPVVAKVVAPVVGKVAAKVATPVVAKAVAPVAAKAAPIQTAAKMFAAPVVAAAVKAAPVVQKAAPVVQKMAPVVKQVVSVAPTAPPSALSGLDLAEGLGIGLVPYLLIPALIFSSVKGLVKPSKPLPKASKPAVTAGAYTKPLNVGAKEGLNEFLSGKETADNQLTKKGIKLSAAGFGSAIVLSAVLVGTSGQEVKEAPKKAVAPAAIVKTVAPPKAAVVAAPKVDEAKIAAEKALVEAANEKERLAKIAAEKAKAAAAAEKIAAEKALLSAR
jgi:hypothetical protein